MIGGFYVLKAKRACRILSYAPGTFSGSYFPLFMNNFRKYPKESVLGGKGISNGFPIDLIEQ